MKTIKKGEWLELIVSEEWAGNTIEQIAKEVWQIPKKLLHQYRMEKGIKKNGEVVPYSSKLNEGDVFQVHMFQEEEYGVLPNKLEVGILFEDEHLIIVNKPAGIDTHPNELGQNNTLANAVAYHLKSQGIKTKVKHIHRLDKDTTGAVLFAKNALAGAILDRFLENRIINRTYLALVNGKIRTKSGVINQPIGRDRHHPTRRRVSPTGQDASTYYEVIEYHSEQDFTLIKFQLHTGRTHQIRVHMSYMGHPLIGDTLYGDTRTDYPRQALHAIKVSLPHPITNQPISCVAPFLDQPPIFEYEINELLKKL